MFVLAALLAIAVGVALRGSVRVVLCALGAWLLILETANFITLGLNGLPLVVWIATAMFGGGLALVMRGQRNERRAREMIRAHDLHFGLIDGELQAVGGWVLIVIAMTALFIGPLSVIAFATDW